MKKLIYVMIFVLAFSCRVKEKNIAGDNRYLYKDFDFFTMKGVDSITDYVKNKKDNNVKVSFKSDGSFAKAIFLNKINNEKRVIEKDSSTGNYITTFFKYKFPFNTIDSLIPINDSVFIQKTYLISNSKNNEDKKIGTRVWLNYQDSILIVSTPGFEINKENFKYLLINNNINKFFITYIFKNDLLEIKGHTGFLFHEQNNIVSPFFESIINQNNIRFKLIIENYRHW